MTEPTIKVPAWRYHATQGAKLFTTEAELIEAEAQGWADSPAAALAVAESPQDTTPVVESEWLTNAEPDFHAPEDVIESTPDDGVIATLEAAEEAVEQGETGEIADALEAAEEAIEAVQEIVTKKRRPKR